MSWASETSIDEFNERYETDEDFRREYDERMQFDAWQEEEFFRRERELEMLDEHFDDKLIDPHGNPIELPEPEPVIIDDDIPF